MPAVTYDWKLLINKFSKFFFEIKGMEMITYCANKVLLFRF